MVRGGVGYWKMVGGLCLCVGDKGLGEIVVVSFMIFE